MSDAANPCPFCGGEAELIFAHRATCYVCVRCRAVGPHAPPTAPDPVAAALALWNARSVSTLATAFLTHDMLVAEISKRYRAHVFAVIHELEGSMIPGMRVDFGAKSMSDHETIGLVRYATMLIEAKAFGTSRLIPRGEGGAIPPLDPPAPPTKQ